MVAMRMRNSAFKNSLKMIPLGAKLRVSPPIGSFTLHRDSSKPAVFLVGGIGITPVLSILAHATDRSLPHRIYLFYCNHDPGKMAFLERVRNVAEEKCEFHVRPYGDHAERLFLAL